MIRTLALLVAITSAVWLAVLWRWQASDHAIEVEDIVLWLGLLPLALFAAALALRWAWGRAAEGFDRRQDAALAAAQAASAPATEKPRPDDPADRTAEAERGLQWTVRAVAVRTAVGEAMADVMQACAAGQPRPRPQAAWRDDDGLPVLAAPIADLEPDAAAWQPALEAALAAVAQQAQAEGRSADAEQAEGGWPEHALRSVAAAQAPLASAFAALHPWQELLAQRAQQALEARRLVAAGDPRTEAPATGLPQLHVLLAWPPEWPAVLGEAALALLQARGREGAFGEWPEGFLHWHRLPDAGAMSGVPAHDRDARSRAAAQDAAGLWQTLDRWLLGWHRSAQPAAVLLVAADSACAADVVARWAAEGQLHRAQHTPQGRMPAEAACAMLLTTPNWPELPDADPPLARLGRCAVGLRPHSIEDRGRVSSSLGETLVQQALQAAGVAPEAVLALVSDADQHSPRTTELFGVAVGQLPTLNPAEDVRLLGSVCGALGAAGSVLTLAAAAHEAGRRGGPCLALSVADPLLRVAALAVPALPTEPPPDHALHTANPAAGA